MKLNDFILCDKPNLKILIDYLNESNMTTKMIYTSIVTYGGSFTCDNVDKVLPSEFDKLLQFKSNLKLLIAQQYADQQIFNYDVNEIGITFIAIEDNNKHTTNEILLSIKMNNVTINATFREIPFEIVYNGINSYDYYYKSHEPIQQVIFIEHNVSH